MTLPADPSTAAASSKLRPVLVAWTILAVAAAVKQVVQGPRHNIYPIFATAAQHWWADQPLYFKYESLSLYVYSPTFAIAFTPFSLLPEPVGGVIWSVLSIAVFVWALRVLVREILPGQWTVQREAVFLGLALVNSVRGVWSAQSNSLLLAMAIFALVAVKKQYWWRAALFLGLCVFIKLWPIVLVAMLVIVRPKQLLPRFAAVVAALAAVPFLTKPWPIVFEQYHGWYACLSGPMQGRLPGFRDAWTIWEQLGLTVHKPTYMAIQVATASGLLIWCAWLSRRHRVIDRGFLTWMLAFWVAWQLLLGPGAERLTYQIYAPLTAWAVVASFAARRGRTLSLTAWLMTGILGTGGVERALLPYLPVAPMILPLGGVVFIVWLMIHFRTPGTPGTPGTHAAAKALSAADRSDITDAGLT